MLIVIFVSGVYVRRTGAFAGDDTSIKGANFNSSNMTTTSKDGNIIPSDCFPAIFGFGDSQMDTGNAVSAFPSRFSSPQSYPYGMSYFSTSSDRYCDGRLFIDFAAQAAGLPLLHPYLKGFGANFASGANFAVVGATAMNTTFITPFHIGAQVDWFRKFKSSVNQALASGTIMQGIRGDGYFEDGLYVISAGGNDVINALIGNPNITNALGTLQAQLPAMANRTIEVVQELYAEGARRFFIKNVPPVGCNPATLTILASPYVEYDMLGCIRSVNTLVQNYGYLLLNAINTLRLWQPDGLFIYGDYFGLIYNMLQRHSNFGFNQTTQNCCGVGGFYNFNFEIRCGQSGTLNGETVEARPCSNPSTYMFWDGIHFTEAANRVIAQQFLRGLYLDPSNALHSLCEFDMSVVNKQ
ncbi:hypothetical protein GOP47_0019944 [Adiantum capillus-veneris]|uniref:Uncharacterized protein n=1 Tax=Adiantum capillus-veneris TaxID=13818 RepID=A0A9D4UDF6_ADICA|nr:hypothetical protein GOP47_0019944 [Adiantum capillus-veneris]